MKITQAQMDYFDKLQHQRFKDKVILHLREIFPDEIRPLYNEDDLSRFILDSIDEAKSYGIDTREDAQLFIDIKVTLQCFQRLDKHNHIGIIKMLNNHQLGPVSDRLDFICERVDKMLARK